VFIELAACLPSSVLKGSTPNLLVVNKNIGNFSLRLTIKSEHSESRLIMRVKTCVAFLQKRNYFNGDFFPFNIPSEVQGYAIM